MDVDKIDNALDELFNLFNGPSLLDTYRNLSGQRVHIVGKFQRPALSLLFLGAGTKFQWILNQRSNPQLSMKTWDPKTRYWQCAKQTAKGGKQKCCQLRIEFILDEEERKSLVQKLGFEFHSIYDLATHI